MSMPRVSSSQRWASRTSPVITSICLRQSACSSQPQSLKELYWLKARTRAPAATSCSARCEPIKPSAPVTSTRELASFAIRGVRISWVVETIVETTSEPFFYPRSKPVADACDSRSEIRQPHIVVAHARTPGDGHGDQAAPKTGIRYRPIHRTSSTESAQMGQLADGAAANNILSIRNALRRQRSLQG